MYIIEKDLKNIIKEEIELILTNEELEDLFGESIDELLSEHTVIEKRKSR